MFPRRKLLLRAVAIPYSTDAAHYIEHENEQQRTAVSMKRQTLSVAAHLPESRDRRELTS